MKEQIKKVLSNPKVQRGLKDKVVPLVKKELGKRKKK